MRGFGLCIGFSGWELNAFYSRLSRDANVQEEENGNPLEVSSLQQSGYHRTTSEISDRNAITMINWGSYIRHSGKWFRTGISFLSTSLSADYQKPYKPCNQFHWRGKNLIHAGVDWLIQPLNNVVVSGEYTLMDMKKWAFSNNVAVFYSNVEMAFHYHQFSRGFDHLLNAPYRISSGGSEWAIFAGILIHLRAYWTLGAQVDLARHPWLRYSIDGPTESMRLKINLQHQLGTDADIKTTFRYISNKKNNQTGREYIRTLTDKDSWRATVINTIKISNGLRLKNRMDYNLISLSNNNNLTSKVTGSSFSQDIIFRPENIQLQATFRWMIFDTDQYESRIYQYEYDVLYAFSVPAYFGTGIRCYLVIKIPAGDRLDFWFKASANKYSRRLIENENYDAGKKNIFEVKLQARIRL